MLGVLGKRPCEVVDDAEGIGWAGWGAAVGSHGCEVLAAEDVGSLGSVVTGHCGLVA